MTVCEFLEFWNFLKDCKFDSSIQDRDYFLKSHNPENIFQEYQATTWLHFKLDASSRNVRQFYLENCGRIHWEFSVSVNLRELVAEDSRLTREIKREDDWSHGWQRGQICREISILADTLRAMDLSLSSKLIEEFQFHECCFIHYSLFLFDSNKYRLIVLINLNCEWI